ncbi:hypothetical protein [Leeuwenhoekiella marinoflava]|uniref:hypothetical protein n=1 Tax=Leeuwenhoekiella marinoflava TaxID=988 RepID=UPI00300247EC
MLKVKIRFWTAHHNMFLYALFYYCSQRKQRFDIEYSNTIPYNCIALFWGDKAYVFDYADTPEVLLEPSPFNQYFKRSYLKQEDYHPKIKPLGLQVNYSYKPLRFIRNLEKHQLLDKRNRIEFLRAIDYFQVSNLSHHSMDIRNYPTHLSLDNKRVIFFTRLWNPNNHISVDEKIRRERQNHFRINACRVLKKNFKNSFIGIYPDDYSSSLCPELLLDKKQISKRNYFKSLSNSTIGIADDGLKDTPGWKLGEYCLFGKAIITTPINVEVKGFKVNQNYLELSDRTSFDEIPEKVHLLLEDSNLDKFAQNNKRWAEDHLHPASYLVNLIPELD